VPQNNSFTFKGLVYFYKNDAIVDEVVHKLFEAIVVVSLVYLHFITLIIRHQDSIDSMPMPCLHFTNSLSSLTMFSPKNAPKLPFLVQVPNLD